MTPIFICEDDAAQLKKLEKIIEMCVAEGKYNFQIILATQKAGEIISYIEDHTGEKGVYFLDVDLKSAFDGIELGKAVKKSNPNNFIIYVTAHSEVAFLTFKNKLGCLDFISKDDWDDVKERISACFKEILTKIEDNQWIAYHKRVIQLNELFYIENSSAEHKIIFHFKDSFIEEWGSLKEVEQCLNEKFFRCDRRVITNLKKIRCVDKNNRKIIFVDERTYDVSEQGVKCLMKIGIPLATKK